nr:hypothetical protein BaRGS_026575 [Batillaria attramentaria]
MHGHCWLVPYWTGDNCTQDINECTVDPNICHAALFEVCRNFDGGYSCDCVSGYHRPSPGDNCTAEVFLEWDRWPTFPCRPHFRLETCAADEVCEEVNGVPQCRVIQEEESDYKLIIGLSVGIPLFFIFAVIIAVLIYMCVKRQREAEQTRPEPSEDRFRSVFASQIPTKGSWGAPHRYQMYSPDTLSDATSESSDPAEGATSNFSWEYMFRLLEPYRGPRRKRPDSMA